MKQKDPEKFDNYVLKLTGKAEIPQKLEIGDKVEVKIEGTIDAITESDNQDGSFTYYFKFVPVIVHLLNQEGKVIYTKDIRRWSQKLRRVLLEEWRIAEINKDFNNDYYPERMAKIIQAVINGEV